MNNNTMLSHVISAANGIIGDPPDTVDGFVKPSDAPARIAAAFSLVLIFISVASVFFFMKGGLDYVMSGGDAGKVKTGLMTLQYSIMGLVVASIGFIVLSVVKNVLGIGSLNLNL